MFLTDPQRATVREKLRPVIDDDQALDALMSQFPASPSDAPATRTDLALAEAALRTELVQLELGIVEKLTDKIHDVEVRMLAILLPFTVAVMAIAVGLAAGLT